MLFRSEVAFTLPVKYKKIAIAQNNDVLYIGGETAEESAPQIVSCNISTKEIESISGGMQKLTEFVISMLGGKYLYILPLNLGGEKIYRTDITAPKPNESSEESKSSIKEIIFEWEAIDAANPNNCASQVTAPAWSFEIAEDTIIVFSGSESILFNTKDSQIINHSAIEQKDIFMHSAWKNDKQVCSYGNQGIYIYSIADNKWGFKPQS